jgi:hypothetical protein
MKKSKSLNEDSAPIKINRSRGSGKKRPDLFARLRNTEHPLDNIFPSDASLFDNNNTVGIVSTVSQPSTVDTNKKTTPIAPEKDFQKVANSVVREVSQGTFNGKSKQMYDYLYSLTRGAIVPKRSIRISKPKLMKGTGIGSPQTFYRNIKYLESLGLIKRSEIVGEWSGNEYQVFLPEEINLKLVQSVQSVQSVKSAQKQVLLVLPETELTVPTSEPINTGLLDTSNTLLKTNTSDDEAFAPFIENLQSLAMEATGKKLSKRDSEKLRELSDLLILEFRIAACRTSNISSVPAFLTEVLRRKLRDIPQIIKLTKVKIDTVGKPESDSYEIKPLDQQGRESAFEQLQEFASDDFLQDFKKWYTPEDWNWLMGKMNGSDKI